MAQTMYAHMNKWIKKKRKEKIAIHTKRQKSVVWRDNENTLRYGRDVGIICLKIQHDYD
jgi:hypothetical protein